MTLPQDGRGRRQGSPLKPAQGEEQTSEAGDDDGRPENWPSDVKYLPNHSIPSSGLMIASNLQLHLCTAPKVTHECHPVQARSQGWTMVKLITEQTPFRPAFGSDLESHPTVGQFGLFARREIPPHTLVVPYLGCVHLTSEEDSESRYDAAIQADDGTRCGIDATHAGNEARFVNDYRGILERPNLFFQDWTARYPLQKSTPSDRRQDDESSIIYPKKVKGLALFSGAHAIRAGTELCASYGKGWWAART